MNEFYKQTSNLEKNSKHMEECDDTVSVAKSARLTPKREPDYENADTYDYYKIDGKKGTLLFTWDALRRCSPQSKLLIGLKDVRDLVNRGYFVYRLNPFTRVTKYNLEQIIKERLEKNR